MRLTYHTDYALRVLLYLAAHPNEHLSNIQSIAAVYGISSNHLMKVVHRLKKLGYLETVRGHGGGLRLAKVPQDIILGKLVRQTEEDLAIVECFNQETNCCVITPVCQLRSVFQEALAAFFQVLDRYTLADVMINKEPYIQLLHGSKVVEKMSSDRQGTEASSLAFSEKERTS